MFTTHISHCIDGGLMNTAIGHNPATWSRFIALPDTSKIQCFPWVEKNEEVVKGCCRNCSVSSAWKAPFVIFKLFFISKSYKSSKSCVNKAPCNSLAKKVQNTTEAARMSHLTTRVNPLIVDEVKLWLK